MLAASIAGCQSFGTASTTAAPALKHVEINGASIAYVEQGSGVPVVFVHGASQDLRVWDGERDAVARNYRFVAYTQRYFGTEPWRDQGGKFSAVQHADDLAAFIRSLGAGPVHLVSWSYGGLVATIMATRHPELVRSQVLYEPTVRSLIANRAESKQAIAEVAAAYGPGSAAVKAGDIDLATRRFAEAVYRLPANGYDQHPAAWRQIWMDSARSVIPQNNAPAAPAISCEQIRASTSPRLVVRGQNSYAMWIDIAEEMARCAPGSLLVVLPGVNHDGPLRDPRAFSTVLMDFLKTH